MIMVLLINAFILLSNYHIFSNIGVHSDADG